MHSVHASACETWLPGAPIYCTYLLVAIAFNICWPRRKVQVSCDFRNYSNPTVRAATVFVPLAHWELASRASGKCN